MTASRKAAPMAMPGLFRRFARFSWRDRAVTIVLVALIIGSFGLAAAEIMAVVALKRENQLVRDLVAGRDRAVVIADGPRALYARIRFLADRELIDEAEALLPGLVQTGDPATIAHARQALGNARMRAAFAAGESQRVDDAVPQVALAKEAFRRALALMPDSYDLKINLDLAMRLVRDFPEGGEASGEEEPDVKPKNLWSELPGVPEGLP